MFGRVLVNEGYDQRSMFTGRPDDSTPNSSINAHASPFQNRSCTWSTPKRASFALQRNTSVESSPMSLEDTTATIATSCQAASSPFVTFFGISEDSIAPDRPSTNQADSSVASFREPAAAPVDANFLSSSLARLLRWEKPYSSTAALTAASCLLLATHLPGHSLLGVAADLALGCSAALAVFQMTSISQRRADYVRRQFARARMAVSVVFA